MSIRHEIQFMADTGNKKINISREFSAPVAQVWRAWTESALLDQWWAPRPWRAETKSQDFRPGGMWLYCMRGPEGEAHWCRLDYLAVAPQEQFVAQDSFCDENGHPSNELPSMHWTNTFVASAAGTRVDIEIRFEKAEDIGVIVEMGFREGFSMALGNLDELLALG